MHKLFIGKRYGYGKGNIVRLDFKAYDLINSKGKLFGEGIFNFLNIEHKFANKTDWNFKNNGKLWNYNLQYFDFLFDTSADKTYLEQLINEVSIEIIQGKLALEPYPVSLRLINWILFHSKTGFMSDSMEKAIRIQIGFLKNNIEYHIQANHLVENFCSLVVSSYFLKDRHLFNSSSLKLMKAVREQILNDGSHYEGSPMYHQILLAKFLILYEIELGQPFGDKTYVDLLRTTISKMVGWLKTIYFSNGSMPLLNDSILGIATDFSTLISVAEKMKIDSTNKVFLDKCGYRCYNTSCYELLVDVGNILPSYQPSHSHSDMLSFLLQVGGKMHIVDLGISTYQSNERRNFERSTLAHNTVTVNRESQSDVWSSFRIGRRAKVILQEDEPNSLCACHDGYSRKYGVTHKRHFKILDNKIVINDQLNFSNNRLSNLSGEFRMYFDHTIKVEELDNGVKAGDIWVTFEKAGEWSLVKYQQPLGYNKFDESTYLIIKFNGEVITTLQVQ